MAKKIEAKLMEGGRVRTGLVRFSFVHVFEPQKKDDGTENYNCAILIDNNDTSTLDAVKKAIKSAQDRGIQELWGGKMPKKYMNPLHDGEEKEDTYEGYEGTMFLNAKTQRKPKVVDKNLDPILDKEDFYSGCYGVATISFWPYKREGNMGVSVSLDNIMKLKDGPQLGGGAASAESDFQDLDTSAFSIDDDDEL